MGKTKKINEDIWPQERDVLFRPDRYKYVRKLIQPGNCVFCDAAKSKVGIKNLKVYETRHSMVVLNKFPYNSGHLLVLPKEHGGEISKLSPVQYTDLMRVLKLTMQVVEVVYGCSGMNVGLNHGRVAGAGIPDHLHWHVIPRWSGDLNFFPLIAETKAVIESLDQTFKKVAKGFKKESQK